MIAQLRGVIHHISAQQIILDVQGVGYAVSVVDERLYQLNQKIALHIYFHWNQDNGPQLYGFDTFLSRTVFSHIISCSGCGPKLGLAVLAHMAPHEFVQAIIVSDIKALSRVGGVGPKKAELMVMHLKDRVKKIAPGDVASGEHETLTKIKQLHKTLLALNYKQVEINAAFESLHKQVTIDSSSFDELLRKSLSFLARK